MASNPAPRAPHTLPKPIPVVGSETAPFIYFDSITCMGTLGGVVEIEVCARALTPSAESTTSVQIVTGHLRFSVGVINSLKDTIQKIEAMLTPPDAKPN